MANNLKLKVTSNSNAKQKNVYKIKLNKKTSDDIQPIIQFKINDNVIHTSEKNLVGKIKFIGDNEISVVWNDGSRERFKGDCIKQLAYVDYCEEVISPLTNQMGGTEPVTLQSEKTKIETKQNNDDKLYQQIKTQPSNLDQLFENAFNDLDDTYDDIEDANPNKYTEDKIKVNKSEATTQKTLNDTIENEAAEKGMTEAELMLKRIKKGGAIVGDFTRELNKSPDRVKPGKQISGYSGESQSRDLTAIKNSPKTYDSNDMGFTVLSEDSAMSNAKTITKHSDNQPSCETIEEPKLNLDVFKDLQGIKQPLQIIAEQKTPKQNLTEAINSLDWTIFSFRR